MVTPVHIPAKPALAKSADFNFLREEGLRHIQQLAALTWTDHNLHDPGITILEAFCYGMTEVGFRSGLDFEELLSAQGEQEGDYVDPAVLLACAPVTAEDFRKLLISNAWVNSALVQPSATALSRYDVRVEFEETALNLNTVGLPPLQVAGKNCLVEVAFPNWEEPLMQRMGAGIIQQAILTGDALVAIRANETYFGTLEIGLNALPNILFRVTIRINTPVSEAEAALLLPLIKAQLTAIDPNSVLATYRNRIIRATRTMRVIRLFLRPYRNLCEDFDQFSNLKVQEIALNATVEVNPGVDVELLLVNIFRAVSRFISDLYVEGGLVEELHTSDFLRVLMQLRQGSISDLVVLEDLNQRGIISVTNLYLSNFIDNRVITEKGKNCLHLSDPGFFLPKFSPSKSRISFIRNGIAVEYDSDKVLNLLETVDQPVLVQPSKEIDLPNTGLNAADLESYYTIQNEFPAIYGIGDIGVRENAPALRLAQAKQLKGYLFVLEQLLANQLSQIAHLADFFSPEAAIDHSYPFQPLYELPGMAQLLTAASTVNWADFVANKENPYIRSLKTGAETPDQFLDRRNRLLDHLLARFGEDMAEFSLINYQIGQAAQKNTFPNYADFLKMTAIRRRRVSKKIIRSKSLFFKSLPKIQRDKFQAFGHLSERFDGALTLSTGSGKFGFDIRNELGDVLLSSPKVFDLEADARQTGVFALSLLTNASFYKIVDAPNGRKRFALTDPFNEQAEWAYGTGDFLNVGACQAAIIQTAGLIRQHWMSYCLAPIESLVRHQIGISSAKRTRLSEDFGNLFEIVDEPGSGAPPKKRILYRSNPTGALLFRSEALFDTLDAAEAGRDALIQIGVKLENWDIVLNASSRYEIILNDDDGIVIARVPTVFIDYNGAYKAMEQISQHLFERFSMEGFYMVENDRLPGFGVFQVSFVFPSGFRNIMGAKTRAYPEKNQDPEFRRYVERTVQKYCPAHILPSVYWIDSNPDNIDVGFERIEAAYFDWLEKYFTEGLSPADLTTSAQSLRKILESSIQFQ